MITLQASSIDELNVIWRRLRTDFMVIENIHLDPKSLQYRMVIKQPDLTAMLRGVADKVLDRLEMYEDNSLQGANTLNQLDARIMDGNGQFRSLEPLSRIWEVISMTDKKAIFSYLRSTLNNDESIKDSSADETANI